jgi:hypothetical protein
MELDSGAHSFVIPPVVAAFVVYLTYPNGSRIRAFLLDVFRRGVTRTIGMGLRRFTFN